MGRGIDFLERFASTKDGAISSKIIVGAFTYLLLVISVVVLMFIHPEFPALSDVVVVLILSSTSLLGLTTVENIRDRIPSHKRPPKFNNGPTEEENKNEEEF